MNADVYRGVISDILENLGLDKSYSGDGSMIDLHLEESGRFTVELCDTGVVLCLAKEDADLSECRLLQLLMSCDHRYGNASPVFGGINESNQIMYMTQISEKDVSVQYIFGELDRLIELHDDLEKGVYQ